MAKQIPNRDDEGAGSKGGWLAPENRTKTAVWVAVGLLFFVLIASL